MSETKIEPKTEKKIPSDQSSDKTVYKRAQKFWPEKLKGIFRSTFNLDRVRVLGLIGLVCAITIILFLTLKGGKKNGKNKNGS